MNIRALRPEDRFAAMRLWQEIFHDSLPFSVFYFAHRFTPELSFGVFDGDALVSMSLGRSVITDLPAYRVILIAGVSTLPEYRRQGLMNETMSLLLANAKDSGFDAAILCPAIPGLYNSLGFRPLSYAIEAEETAANPLELNAVAFETNPMSMLPLYRIIAHKHPMMLSRDETAFRMQMWEYAAEQGRMLITKDRKGYLCFLPQKDGLEVTECLAASPMHYRLLLRAAAACSPSGTASAKLPADCGLAGKVLRPIHALALCDDFPIEQIAKLRNTFLFEQF